jgi:uncharacterized pyridoxamine 5'-phosphate oxidase family protein
MRKTMALTILLAAAGFGQEAAKPAAQQTAKSYVLVKEAADRQDSFMQEAAAFLEKAGYFYLATVDGDGARVRPIKYTFIMDNKVLFVTSSKKEVYAQLLKNPKVELSRTAEDKSAYFRYKGKAVLCTDADIKAKLLEAHPNFNKSFGENIALFFVEPEMAGLFPMKGGQPKTKVFTK